MDGVLIQRFVNVNMMSNSEVEICGEGQIRAAFWQCRVVA